MNYKIIYSLFWGCFFTYNLSGQAPTWEVSSDYVHTMSLIVTGDSDCFSSFNTSDIVGVFDKAGNCRGKGNLGSFSSGYKAFILVKSNKIKDTLSYRVYDASADAILYSPTSVLPFDAETNLGTLSMPEVVMSCEPLPECTAKLELTEPIMTTAAYQARDSIISTSAISGGDTEVVFEAGKAIILKTGFSVSASSNFTARIVECTTAELSQKDMNANLKIRQNSIAFQSGQETEKQLRVQISPNPSSLSTEIKYYLIEDAVVNMYLSDWNGKLVHQINNQKSSSGWNTNRLDIHELAMGIYFLTISTAKEATTKKIIVIK